MLKVGLTGGIGSGKSTVSAIFKKLGAYIFDADSVAKYILENNETAQNEIIAEFGTDVLGPNEKIKKSKLARIAFQDENHQFRLNTIIHPYIFNVIYKKYDEKSLDKKYDIFAIDAALIYESSLDTHLDYVVVITSHLKLRIKRVMTRGELTREEFLKRRELQWPDEDKVHMADFVIHNNSTAKVLEEETKKVYNLLL